MAETKAEIDEEVVDGGAKQEEEEEDTLQNSDVTTKYQEAAKIVNSVLQAVSDACAAGVTIIHLCKLGDSLIGQRCSQIFRSKQKGRAIEKGIAFPTCVSINECVCHNSPLESEESEVINEGDLVKIDLGCHIDGYIAVAAHTVQVGGGAITGVRADVMAATYTAAEVAAKLIKNGNTNHAVTTAIKRVAEAYGVNLVAGTLMHQMKRYVIDGSKMILLREELEQKVEECTFEQYEVYAVDVAMSSGEGKPRESGDARTTVFKRTPDRSYRLKMKASRYLFNEITNRFPSLPFTLRAMADERQARMGVRECLTHELIHPYPVLFERQGDQVAHVKFTVLLLPSGTAKVTGLTLPAEVVCDKTLDEETASILAASSKKKKKKKKKVRAGEGKEDAADAADADAGDAPEEAEVQNVA